MQTFEMYNIFYAAGISRDTSNRSSWKTLPVKTIMPTYVNSTRLPECERLLRDIAQPVPFATMPHDHCCKTAKSLLHLNN